MFDLKRIQPLVDFMAETGRDKTEIDFDDLNDAIGEIERLRAEVVRLQRCCGEFEQVK